jgi:phospholipid-translocating ATPase
MNIHSTDWVVGRAHMTGYDTKAMQNLRHPPAKRTQFDIDINKMIVDVFVMKLVIILILSTVRCIYERGDDFPNVKMTTILRGNSFLIAFMLYFVLYSYWIPISLIVTIEIIRLCHIFVIL